MLAPLDLGVVLLEQVPLRYRQEKGRPFPTVLRRADDTCRYHQWRLLCRRVETIVPRLMHHL